jgi:hypothetical protein
VNGARGADGTANPNYTGLAPSGGAQVWTTISGLFSPISGGAGAVNQCLLFGSSAGGNGGLGCASAAGVQGGAGTAGTANPEPPRGKRPRTRLVQSPAGSPCNVRRPVSRCPQTRHYARLRRVFGRKISGCYAPPIRPSPVVDRAPLGLRPAFAHWWTQLASSAALSLLGSPNGSSVEDWASGTLLGAAVPPGMDEPFVSIDDADFRTGRVHDDRWLFGVWGDEDRVRARGRAAPALQGPMPRKEAVACALASSGFRSN